MVQTVRGGEGLYDLVYETGAGKFDDEHGGKFWTDTGGSKLCSQAAAASPLSRLTKVPLTLLVMI